MSSLGARSVSAAGVITCTVLLLLTGCALLALAKVTPWHSSEEFYEASRALMELWGGESPDFDAMSAEFHALQDRYRTNKWLYADLGYLSLSVALLLAVGERSGFVRRAVWSVHARLAVVAAFFLAYGAFWLGVSAQALHVFYRGLMPPWADTLAIPVMASILVGGVLVAPVALLLLWPLVRRRTQAKSLAYFNMRAPIWSALWTLIYAPLGLGLVALAILYAADSGSWASSPGLAALGWLALNARVLAIAPRLAAPTAAEGLLVNAR